MSVQEKKKKDLFTHKKIKKWLKQKWGNANINIRG